MDKKVSADGLFSCFKELFIIRPVFAHQIFPSLPIISVFWITPLLVNCGYFLSRPLSNAGFTSHLCSNPPVSCTRAFCWFLQHSHTGVDIFLSFFFFFFPTHASSSKAAAYVSEQRKRPDIPTVMSMLVQYLRKLVVEIIPKEGVSVESHTHTLWVTCQEFGWGSV